MRYFSVYLFIMLISQNTFVKASVYVSEEFKPVRKIVLSLLPQTSDGLKDFLNYRLVSRQFRIESRDTSLWMRFLPILGLSPNIDRSGNVLFAPPHSPALKWTVPSLLEYLSQMLEIVFSQDANTNSDPCQWACYRLVELCANKEYEKLIPQDGKPMISDVAKALLIVHSAIRDRKSKQCLENFSTLVIFDECPGLHNLRVALMQPLIVDILRTIEDYKLRIIQIGTTLIDPDSYACEMQFAEEKRKILEWLVREDGEIAQLSYAEEFAKPFLGKIINLKPENYKYWRFCYKSYEQMDKDINDILVWIESEESELEIR